VAASERKRRLRAVVRVLISVGVLVAFLATVDLERIRPLLRAAQPLPLLGILLISVGRMPLGALRLRLLLRNHDAPLGMLTRHYFIGSMFNILLPTAIGGDAARAVLLTREAGVPAASGLTALVLERVTGSVMLVLLALIGVAVAPLPGSVGTTVLLVCVAAVLGAVGLLVGLALVPPARWPHPSLQSAGEALRSQLSEPGALALVFLYGLVFQLVSAAGTWFVALAFEIDVSVLTLLGVVPLVWLVTMLPVSIGGVGVREVTFAYLLGLAGVSKEASLLLSLGTYAILVVAALVGVGFWLRSGVRGLVKGEAQDPSSAPE
jgi:uncharacterized membrane protein YbhN (UPF0104 family)